MQLSATFVFCAQVTPALGGGRGVKGHGDPVHTDKKENLIFLIYKEI